MGTYIIRPKAIAAESLSMATRSFAPEYRQGQIEQLRKLRASDPVEKEIRKRVDSLKGVDRLSNGQSTTPVTGTTIAKMSAD